MKRRLFLQSLLLASTYSLVTGCTDEAVPSGEVGTAATATPGSRIDVIVVGAGMAGLAAARALHDQGYHVVIVEARNRPGGRVWTNRAWPDTPLDMGASWIHGVRNNPISELADRFEAERITTDYDDMTLYDADGYEVDEEDVEELDETVEELLGEVEAAREELDEDRPLGALLAETLAEWELPADEEAAVWHAVNLEIEQDYAAGVDELSAWYWDDEDHFGGEDVVFPNGYDQIVNGLAQGLDIRLNHTVQQVSYDSAGVRVMTDQGELAADYAVITLPLGVLQSGRVQFSPPLPAGKQAAVERLGMGVLNKLYLRFPTVFWEEEGEWIGYIGGVKGEWAIFLNQYQYTGRPVLLAFNAGPVARRLETLSDEQTVAAAMTVLRTIFGEDIPEPEAWQLTRWASDPLAGGSYSYRPVGASGDDHDRLAEPVSGRLFFAGEATSADHSATVHGAYLSGVRAAEEIAEL